MDTKQLLEAAETIRILKNLFDTPQNQWLPVVAALGGAFVGGISTIVPNYLMELKKRRDERIRVRSALVAEVRALLQIIEHRKYIDNIKQAAEQLRNEPGKLMRFSVRIPDHYCRVYQAHVERIGVIDPPLAAKIIQFYQLLDAIVQDITLGGPLSEAGGGAEAFTQMAEIMDAAFAIGHEIAEH